MGQRQLQDETRNVYVWGLDASYIRELTVRISLWPNDIIWHQTSWSTFVHEMTRCMLGTKPLPEPMLNYCQLDPKEHTSMIFFFWGRGSQIFIQENQFETVVCCKLLIIVLRPGWVNSLTSGRGGNNFEILTIELILRIDILTTSYEIVLRRMPNHQSHDKSTLIQVMAWC